MGILGKDLFNLKRPNTHIKVRFGDSGYWIEDMEEALPYGTILTELLNYDAEPYHRMYEKWTQAKGEREKAESAIGMIKEIQSLPLYCLVFLPDLMNEKRLEQVSRNAEHDLRLIQERYAWFLTEMYKDAPPEKKKGQKKEALALRIYKQCIDAFVSGISLGADTEVDAPQLNVQYEIVSIDDEHAELAEKMYFDRLADFVYVELMKGIQHDFIPKCCQNCGRWFLQQPGMTYNYCGELAPGEAKLTCRDIGAAVSFKAKVQNNEIWQIHQRAYKKYYARIKKGNMSKAEFERWARNAEELRDEALQQYEFLHAEDERKEFIESFREDMNRE